MIRTLPWDIINLFDELKVGITLFIKTYRSFKAFHKTRFLVSGTTVWLSHLRPSISKADKYQNSTDPMY